MARPIPVNIFSGLAVFLSISAITGGAGLIIDPSGKLMNMPLSLLKGTPFPDFFLPGLGLFILFGAYPLFCAYALIALPKRRSLDFLRISSRHWAWTLSFGAANLFIVWAIIEMALVGYYWLQLIYIALGIAMIILLFLPSSVIYVRKAGQKT